MSNVSNSEEKPLLELRNVKKHFGSVKAVDGVDLKIYEGESIGLVGDNGAGKTTLIKTITGIQPKDEGEILLKGEEVEINSTKDSEDLGIEACYQDLALAETIDVVGNIFLGREITKGNNGKKFGLLSRMNFQKMREKAKEQIKRFGIDIADYDAPIEDLSGGQRQSVAIAKAILQRDINLLILDEPTSALSVEGIDRVLETINKLRESGQTIITISHDLEHVFAVSDRIVVMRRGKICGIEKAAESNKNRIVNLICDGTVEETVACAGPAEETS